MRPLRIIVPVLVAFGPAAGNAQTPAPTPVDWSADDSARIAAIMAGPQRHARAHVIVWAPADSLDARWLAAFVDTLAASLDSLRARIGGPYAWQRIGARPVEFYLSPGRFVSHASGFGSVFISLTRVHQDAPFLHEAAHELLAPQPPFYADEYADSLEGERAVARFPLWLLEGVPDYLAQATAAVTTFPEGDVFAIGGLARVDSVCAARLAASPRRAEILEKVGGQGRLGALFTTERAQVAPVFYACSQSFSKYLVDRVGLRAVIALFPGIPPGTWLRDLERAAGEPLGELRRRWLAAIESR